MWSWVTTFSMAHPWKFCFFVALPSFFFAGNIVVYGFKFYNRTVRFLNIWAGGWPPAHLDADGDAVPVRRE